MKEVNLVGQQIIVRCVDNETYRGEALESNELGTMIKMGDKVLVITYHNIKTIEEV